MFSSVSAAVASCSKNKQKRFILTYLNGFKPSIIPSFFYVIIIYLVRVNVPSEGLNFFYTWLTFFMRG